jgi:hypothetical protein
MLYSILLGITIGFILFTIYVAFFVKGIIFRSNSQGKMIFTPKNLFNLAIYPVKSIDFWKPQMWTINFFLYSLISVSITLYLTQYTKKSPIEQINP